MSDLKDEEGGLPGRFATSFTFWMNTANTLLPSRRATTEPYADTCFVVVFE